MTTLHAGGCLRFGSRAVYKMRVDVKGVHMDGKGVTADGKGVRVDGKGVRVDGKGGPYGW
eukprot:4782320-Pyramimonas_sp.AAC.1